MSGEQSAAQATQEAKQQPAGQQQEQEQADQYDGMQVEEDNSLYFKQVEAKKAAIDAQSQGKSREEAEKEAADAGNSGEDDNAEGANDQQEPAESPTDGEKEQKQGERADETGTEDDGGDAEGEKSDDGVPKGVQDRIDELTRRFRDEERKRVELENEIKRLQEEQPAGEGEKGGEGDPEAERQTQVEEYGFTLDPEDPEPTEPDPDDPDDQRSYGEWIREHHKWTTRNLARYQREQQRESEQQEAIDAQRQEIEAKMEVGRKAHKDFNEVVGEADQSIFTPDMREAIASSDQAAELAYQLASQPDEARRIAALDSPLQQMREVVKFESGLAADTGGNKGEESPGNKADNDDEGGSGKKKEREAADNDTTGQQQPKKQPSKAPPPIETLGGRENKDEDLANMSQADYNRKMEERLKRSS